MPKRCAVAAFGLIALIGPALAQSGGPAGTAIRDALTKWTQAFNAGDTAAVCGLFARDLRYDYRGYPERGFDDVCALLPTLASRSRPAIFLFARDQGDPRVGRSRRRAAGVDA